MAAEWRAGFDADDVDAVKAARRIKAPLLAIVDGEDRRMPERVVRRVWGAHPGPKDIWIAPGVDHVGAVQLREHPERIDVHEQASRAPADGKTLYQHRERGTQQTGLRSFDDLPVLTSRAFLPGATASTRPLAAEHPQGRSVYSLVRCVHCHTPAATVLGNRCPSCRTTMQIWPR